MARTPASNVQRQVAKATRRLFVQTLLDHLVWCWAGALLAATLGFAVQPWLLGPAEDWVRWAVAGTVLTAATGLAVWLACLRAPSAVSDALELDQRFQLKERVTTSLTLAPHLTGTAAGQA